MPTSKVLDWAGGKEMSGDFEIFSEEYWRRRSEETKKKNKTKEVEWIRNPVRGEPVSGTGKHRGDKGNGRPRCTLRRRGGQLIGCRSGERWQPKYETLRERNKKVFRKGLFFRADSDAGDTTFEEHEREIERWLAEEEAFQEAVEKVPEVEPMIYVHVDPATSQEVAAWERGELDEELEDDEAMGLEGEEHDEDEEHDVDDINVDEELLVQEGLQFKRFDDQLKRVVVDRTMSEKSKPDDLEDQLFDDPLGSLIGEWLGWHNPNWFVPVVL